MSGQSPLPSEPIDLPLLPLRDVVVFPHMVIPLFVGRPKSIKALEASMAAERRIMLVAQKAAAKDEPAVTDMFDVGCMATILQMLKLPDGTVKVLVEGQQRAHVNNIVEGEEHFTATITPMSPTADPSIDTEIEALRRAVMQQFDQYVKLNKKIPPEILTSISSIDDAGRLADTIAAHLPLKLENKQVVLDLIEVKPRLENLFEQIEREVDILNVDKRIRGRVKRQMEKNQRDFYLNEQVKAIQKELGEGEEGADIEEIEKKIKLAKMPADARKKAEGELKKLKLMSPMSAEATVVRNYIDVLVGLPWSKRTKIKHDLGNAEDVLNEDHYGLEKVKDRILEYLAVQQRVDKVKAPILCLVGPPGVGKTSLGQSIAKATGRKYVRMALGGMRDEAEIRGHRRTYIGALPGKVLQNLTKVNTRNPLFLLDEIDKLGSDFRGDPSSALLEVLDPEQNHTFNDHYVEVDFDLSDVMFVATSNSMNIPPALLDRMEVIRLSGYTEDEKTHIAMRYLLPKQMKNNGVKDEELLVEEGAIRDMVRYYTREAGVRSLERELSKICRKVVKFEKKDIHIHVPDGATPKDGPSAGAAMVTAIVSTLTGIPVRADVAMTGEITLRGEVTAIGGLKEKLLAALRGGIKTVMIPEENVKDLQDIPENVKNGLEIVPVKWVDKVLEVALEKLPTPLPDEAPAVAAPADGTQTPAASVKH
ncbi:MAG: endopeptidase La [Betaproteobacteria bacterium]|nr:endopeptidase La [Betaproteobacteria bacterium]